MEAVCVVAFDLHLKIAGKKAEAVRKKNVESFPADLFEARSARFALNVCVRINN